MTRRLTFALLTGILAIPLCSTGSVPSSSHAVRKALVGTIGNRTTLIPIGKVRSCQRCPRSKSLPRTPAVRTRADEPAVVILYGNRPWSWM